MENQTVLISGNENKGRENWGSLVIYTAVVGATAAALMLFAGCGKAQEATAEKAALDTVALETHELSKLQTDPLVMSDVKMFFWREGVSPDDIGKVNALAKRLDKLQKEELPAEETAYLTIDAKYALKATQESLDAQETELKANKSGAEKNASLAVLESDEKALNTDKEGYQRKKDNINTMKARRDELQAKAKAIAPKKLPYKEGKELEKLEKDIAAQEDPVAEKQVLDSFAQREAALNTKKSEIQANIDAMAVADAQLAELEAQRKDLGSKAEEVGSYKARVDTKKLEVEQVTQDIVNSVDWYDKGDLPASLVFKADAEGKPAVDVINWKHSTLWPSGSKEFTSEKGGVLNLTYKAEGGVYQFDLNTITEPVEVTNAKTQEKEQIVSESLNIKISRKKQSELDGGILYMQGDVVRTRVIRKADGAETTEKRRGTIKLATNGS